MRLPALLLLTCCLGLPAVTSAQAPDSLPDGVTPRMIEEGRTLYHGAAICLTCHGPDGAGVRGIGPAFTDDEWLHSDGSFEAIVEQIRTGVSSEQSTSGVMMPPRGGANLTEAQIRAVAAYVWSLSHRTD